MVDGLSPIAPFEALDSLRPGVHLSHARGLILEREQPEVVRTEGDVPEGGVAQIPIDTARDLQLRAVDIDILVPRR